MAPGLVTEPDGTARCWWCAAAPEYRAYHDREWGRPVTDDRTLFGKFVLETFQSGLSWLTVLRKREHFRRAFCGFDFEQVARFNRRSVDRLLQDVGIIRNRAKIEAAINNAKRACELVDEAGSLAAFLWRYEPDPATRPDVLTRERLLTMPTSPESVRLSKDLKARGWTFVGPTTLYAHMQAMG
ncbi:MAG: DNA-3-methyladenine glycosylase I, partial [Gemmatimonadales bacterium]|nr:DNA-3-methyladenine glycosylase I [Gemmatimonadales bacterium]